MAFTIFMGMIPGTEQSEQTLAAMNDYFIPTSQLDERKIKTEKVCIKYILFHKPSLHCPCVFMLSWIIKIWLHMSKCPQKNSWGILA